MKHSNRKAFSGRFTPEIQKVFNTFSEELTDSAIVATLCENYENEGGENEAMQRQLQALQTENSNLLSKYADLQIVNEGLQKNCNDLQPVNEKLQSDYIDLQHAYEELQRVNSNLQTEKTEIQRISNENAVQMQKMTLASENPEKGKYLVEFSNETNEIMSLTLERLRVKLNKPEISVNTLINDLLVKYLTHKLPSGISFPQIVKSSEIKLIMKKYQVNNA